MKRVFLGALAGLLLSATGPQALTTSTNDSTVYQLPDSIVVTANRFGLPVERTIWPARIISQSTLQSSLSLDLALDGEAGVDIRNYSGLGSLATLSSWGALARHMLLLYDGRPVRDYSLGGFNLAEFSPDEFSRVEFLKGPQSAFYGSDAVAGVVNLVTPSTLLDRCDLSTRMGSYGTRQYGFDVAKRVSTFGVGGFANYEASDNRRSNSGAYRTIAGLRSDYLSKDGHHAIRLSGRFFDDSLGVPGPQPDPHAIPDVGNAESSSLYDYQTDRKYAVDAQYRYHPTASFTAQMDGFWERKDITYFSRYMLNGKAESATRHRSSGITGRFMKTIGRHTVSSGLDVLSGSVRESSLDSSGYGVFPNSWAKRQNQIDVWSAATIGATRTISLDLSGRLQFVRDRRTQPSYDLGSVFALSDGFSVRIAYGYAFRLPSIADQYVTGPYTQGNPNLRPETSRAFAATLSIVPRWKDAHVDVTAFHRTVAALIQYVADPVSFKYVPVNVDRMHSTGIDMSARLMPMKAATVSWSGVWQEARQSYGVDQEMVPAFYIPSLKWRFDGSLQLTRQISSRIGIAYTGERSIRMAGGTKRIASVYELSAGLSIAVGRYVDVSLDGTDLTDARRPDQFGFSLADHDYPSPGRTISLHTTAHIF